MGKGHDTIMKALYKKLRYAVLLFRIAGLSVLFRELRRQIYSKTYYIGMERDLDNPIFEFQTDIKYKLQRGKNTDIDEIMTAAKSAGKTSAYELVMRKRFYDSGFQNFYVARSTYTGELCYIAWLLSAADYPELLDGFKGIPPVKENEVLMFNLFAFEKYRKKGLAYCVNSDLCKIAKKRAYERAIAYPLKNNIAGVKALENIGFKKYCLKFERRLLFSVKREFRSELNTFSML